MIEGDAKVRDDEIDFVKVSDSDDFFGFFVCETEVNF